MCLFSCIPLFPEGALFLGLKVLWFLLPRAKKLIFSSDPPGEEPPPAGEGATAADEQTELS
jgi:hypothetical protein